VEKTRVSEVTATEILNKLSELDAIDKLLWQERVIWCQNFVEGVADVYKKRNTGLPTKPKCSFRRENPTTTNITGDGNPQSKVKETIVNNINSSSRSNLHPDFESVYTYFCSEVYVPEPDEGKKLNEMLKANGKDKLMRVIPLVSNIDELIALCNGR
jgi:hypothetical protein